MMHNMNESFPIKALDDEIWLNEHLRPLRNEEIILKQFTIFSAESMGRENFSLSCITAGNFELNSVRSHCEMGELVSLPENTWNITNKDGVYQHFKFRHHLKSKVINNTGWQKLALVKPAKKNLS